MKKAFFIPLASLILLGSCKKTTSNSNGNYSNWKLTTNNNDNGSYNAHPNDVISSEGDFDLSNSNYVSLYCDGFVDSANTYNKTSEIFISFLKKPTTNRTYKIGNTNRLTDSTCFISLAGNFSNDYNSTTSGQIVNVTVNGGKVTASFTNVSLTGSNMYGTQQWPASLSGSVIEGK